MEMHAYENDAIVSEGRGLYQEASPLLYLLSV